MKKLLLSFLSLFLIAGVALAESKTETFDFKDSDYGLERNANDFIADGTIITSGDINIKLTKTAGNGWRLWDDGLRAYKGEGPIMTVTAGGNKIDRIEITQSKKTIITSCNGSTISTTDFTVNCNGATESKLAFKVANNGAITKMAITYQIEVADTREEVTLSFPAEEYTAKLGEAFEAPVLSGAPEGAEIVYTSSDETVATVAATGAVTPVGVGTTTITALFEGNDAYQPAKPVSYTLTVIDPNGPIALWKLVTDDNELNEGDVVAIACSSKRVVMSTDASDPTTYCKHITATFYNGVKFIADDAEIMQFELGKDGNYWTFKTLNFKGTNGYIGNGNTAKNYCNVNAELAQGYYATITIGASGDAEIKFNSSARNLLKYNASSPRFSCYDSGQTDVQIYKLITVEQPIAAPVAEVALNDVELVSEYGFDVMYAVTAGEDQVPTEFEEYSEAIVLKNLEEGNNYIWAKSVVGPYESEVECIHVYENVGADEPACTYTHYGVTPDDNCWVVIGVEVNGKHYFMGPDGKATAATVVENKFAGYASHFNNTVNEYLHVAGNLTVKPGAAKVVARAAVGENMTLAVDDNTGVATVSNGDGTLGFDVEKKVFSTEADNKALKVFATDGDVNTGVDNVAVDGENAAAEYYNMQGVRVENPAKGGLYIKRQGSKVSKVAL